MAKVEPDFSVILNHSAYKAYQWISVGSDQSAQLLRRVGSKYNSFTRADKTLVKEKLFPVTIYLLVLGNGALVNSTRSRASRVAGGPGST